MKLADHAHAGSALPIDGDHRLCRHSRDAAGLCEVWVRYCLRRRIAAKADSVNSLGSIQGRNRSLAVEEVIELAWPMSVVGTLRHSPRRIILSPVGCTADKHGRRPLPAAQ
jgi:hypothetical protein